MRLTVLREGGEVIRAGYSNLIGFFAVRAPIVALALAMGLLVPAGLSAQEDAPGGPGSANKPSGLPVPRFVSLKSDRVNVRKGPSPEHGIAWVFNRAGLPVEITAEFGHWRKVRDAEGAEGWVFRGLLSARRTAVVSPWVKEVSGSLPLYAGRSEGGAVVAKLQPGVLTSVTSCDGEWCRLSLDKFEGWMKQDRLWGVYRNERIQ